MIIVWFTRAFALVVANKMFQYLTRRRIKTQMALHAASRRRRCETRKNRRREELEAEMNFSSYSISCAESLNCFYEFRKLHSFNFAQQFQ